MRAPIGQYWALSPALLVGPLRDCKSKARKFSFTGKFQFSALSYWPRNRSVNTARFRHTVKTVLSVNKLLVILNTLVSYENWVVPQCNNIDNCLCVLAVDLKIFWSPANSEACKHTKQSISQSVSQSVSQSGSHRPFPSHLMLPSQDETDIKTMEFSLHYRRLKYLWRLRIIFSPESLFWR